MTPIRGTQWLRNVVRHPVLEWFFRDLRESLNELEYDRRMFLQRQGSTMLFSREGNTINIGPVMVNYDLRSFDGGKIWYACERGPDGEVKILGTVDEVHPQLRESLATTDHLVDRAFPKG
jgi:hypothetical protein